MRSLKVFFPITLGVLLTLVLLKGFNHPVSAQAVPTAATFYVDAVSGDDSVGDGSQAAPWRTITFALTQISAGDTLMVLPGTYDAALGEVFPIVLPPDVKLIGAGREHTIISGVSDKSVVYIGSTTINIPTGTLLSDLTLQNGNIGLEVYASELMVVEPTVSNLLLRWNYHGINIATSGLNQDGAIIHAIISNTESTANSGHGVHIHVDGDDSGSTITTTFEKCLVHHNELNGFNFYGKWYETYSEPTIIDSHIYANGSHGIFAAGTNSFWVKPRVQRTTITDNGGYGLYWGREDASAYFDGILKNVLIARNQQGGIYLGSVSTYWGSSHLQLINSNVIRNQSYGIYWQRSGWNIQPWIINSILWNPGADDLYSSGAAWSTDQVQHSIIEDGDFDGMAGNFSYDPRLMDDYHLETCSPAVDRGTSSSAPEDDLEGDPRPWGAGYDIGADEVQTLCALDAFKVVSTREAVVGDSLAYTLTLQNKTAATPLNVTLADVLQPALTYQEGTLWASQGTPEYESGLVSWLGTIAPGETVTIGLQTVINTGGLTVTNQATVDAGVHGSFETPECKTAVDLARLYLPALFHDYCWLKVLDDFSDPESGWPSGITDDWIFGYQDNEYRLYARAAYDFMVVTRGDQAVRFNLRVDIRQVDEVWDDDKGSYGIMFGLTPDWSEFYTFEIYTFTKEWAIYHYDATGWHLVVTNTSAAIRPYPEVNTIEMNWREEANGRDSYSLLVNGTLVRIYAPWVIGEPARYVGLVSTSISGGFDTRFDHYQFTPGECYGWTPTTGAVDALIGKTIVDPFRIMDVGVSRTR